MCKIAVLLGMALANHLRLQTSSRWLDLHHEAACTIYPRLTTYNFHPRRVQSPDTDHLPNVSPRRIKGHTRAEMSDIQMDRLILRSCCPKNNQHAAQWELLVVRFNSSHGPARKSICWNRCMRPPSFRGLFLARRFRRDKSQMD